MTDNITHSTQSATRTCTINGHALGIATYQGQRVVSFAMVDEVHERPEGTARKRFNDNKTRFIEKEDFFSISASEIRTHKIVEISPKTHGNIILLTESGYLMLAKSLTDDLAWQVQRQLVKGYFRAKEASKASPAKENVDTTLPLRRARLAFSSALRFNRQMGMEIGMARLKALATAQAQTGIDVAKAYGWQAQAQAQPVPYQERTLNATEIGQHFSTNARGANQLLKNMGYQTDSRDAKGRIVWTPTEKGRPYARLEDQTKAHTEGTVQQWRWYPTILEALKAQGGVA